MQHSVPRNRMFVFFPYLRYGSKTVVYANSSYQKEEGARLKYSAIARLIPSSEEESEMFVSIRKYKSSSPDELIRRASEGFVPIISKAPGFVAYYLVKGGGGASSVSIFETKAGVEESDKMAATWVKANVASLVAGPPEITEGEAREFKKK